MPKSLRAFTIEADIYERFQARWPQQASAFVESAMRKRLDIEENALDGVSEEILDTEEKKAQKIADEVNLKLAKIKEQREAIKNKSEEARLQKLNEEKDRLEKLRTCAGCGGQIGDNSKKYDVGEKTFCHECFMNSHPKFLAALKEKKV